MTPPSERFLGVYRGWWIVAIAFAINAMANGIYFMGFAVFLLPISRDLQISRAAASLPYALARLMGAISGPTCGLIVERVGPTKLLFASGLLAGTGYILLSWSPSYLVFMLVFVFIIATGVQGGFDTPGMFAVSQWFVRRRGMAFAVASMGYAFGGATIAPLLALGVNNFGWRTTAFIAGIVIFAVVLPLSALVRRPPDDGDPRPGDLARTDTERGGPSAQASPSVALLDSGDFTLREALRTRTYWFLAISYGLRAMAWSAFALHLVGILIWKGMEESSAGLMLGLFPFFWMPASLMMGWMADRWPKHRVAGVGGIIAALGMVLLLLIDNLSVWQVVLVFVILAPNEGSWALAWAMIGDQFGRRHFGVLRGGILASLSLFSVGAPFYSGWIFDRYESYLWVVLPVAGVLVVAGLLNWLMPPAARRGSAERVETPPALQPSGAI